MNHSISLIWIQCQKVFLVLAIIATSLISVNKLFFLSDKLVVSSTVLGAIGWSAVIFTLIYLSRKNAKHSIIVFFCFLCFGYFSGPYLEPPVDPLEHLRRTEENCNMHSSDMKGVNSGFWHYSLSGILLCKKKSVINAELRLKQIDILNGIYWGTLMVCLFNLGKASGLPNKWTFFSCSLAFLFFGTNRFSYFCYYSLAPSFSSLFIYWTWTTVFFFRRCTLQRIFVGTLFAFFLFPILWLNHKQEAGFLLILCSLWIGWHFHQWLWLGFCTIENKLIARTSKIGYLCLVFFIFMVLPQFVWFQNLVFSKYHGINYWSLNQHHVYFWNGFHLFGKIWGNRVHDTFGILGFLLLALSPLFFWNRFKPYGNSNAHFLILISGLLPFFIFFTPLLHFFWNVTARTDVYYRICYASIYWLPLSYLMYRVYCYFYEKFSLASTYSLGRLLFPAGILAICLLGGVRSARFMGNLILFF